MRVSRCVCVALVVAAGSVGAQQIQLGAAQPRGKEHVALLTDSAEIKPGVEQEVELRFRVDEGYHINSHTPKDELLIPTVLQLDSGRSGSAVVRSEEYPAGSAFRLTVGDGELLSVYQGEFRVRVRLQAAAGASVLTGSLKYQACDNASCFPPRTLPVKVALLAR